MAIPVLYFRSSSMTQWDYCQLSYYITYVLGYQQPGQKKSNLGTIVHKTLECLAQAKKRLQLGENRGMKILDSELGEVKFTKKSLYSNKFVHDILGKAYCYYVDHDKINDYHPTDDYEFCKQMVYNCLDYNGSTFYDPRNMQIVAPEKSFNLPIMEDWAEFDYQGVKQRLHVKGTMDLITEASPSTLEYVDYKTGQRLDWATGQVKTYDKLQNDLQLLLYYYAMSKIYPNYDHIIMTIFFLRDGGPFSLCFDRSDEEKFLKRLKDRFFEIKDSNMVKPINPTRNDFRCKRLCHYYKTNWPGTNTRMCNHVEDTIKTYGIEYAGEQLKAPGFELGFYSAPGSV
jgi:ATP-dependent helicase/DNAse subunit B